MVIECTYCGKILSISQVGRFMSQSARFELDTSRITRIQQPQWRRRRYPSTINATAPHRKDVGRDQYGWERKVDGAIGILGTMIERKKRKTTIKAATVCPPPHTTHFAEAPLGQSLWLCSPAQPPHLSVLKHDVDTCSYNQHLKHCIDLACLLYTSQRYHSFPIQSPS